MPKLALPKLVQKIKQNWKLILAVFFVLIILGIAVYFFINSRKDSLETMETFVDPKNRFSVLLPSQPKESINQDIEEYSSSNGKAKFTIRVVPVKDGNSQEQQTYELQNIMRLTGGSAKIIYADVYTDSSGSPYMDYKVTNDTHTSQGRMFLIENTLYLLLEYAPTENHDDSRFNHFRSSFTLN